MEPNNKMVNSDVMQYPSVRKHLRGINRYAVSPRNRLELASLILKSKRKQQTQTIDYEKMSETSTDMKINVHF